MVTGHLPGGCTERWPWGWIRPWLAQEWRNHRWVGLSLDAHSRPGEEGRGRILPLGVQRPWCADQTTAFRITCHETSTAVVPVVQMRKLRYKQGNGVNASSSRCESGPAGPFLVQSL